jgi:hypothetical protein
MLLPILSLPTPPKPKRSKENDSSENATQEMEKETVDEGHMDEPNDVSISSDDDDEVYVCSNKHGTHKPSRIDLNPMAAEFWPPFPKSSSGSVLSSRSEVLPSLSDTQ